MRASYAGARRAVRRRVHAVRALPAVDLGILYLRKPVVLFGPQLAGRSRAQYPDDCRTTRVRRMSNALIIMLAAMGGTTLLRAPISFGTLAGGIAAPYRQGEDVGLMASRCSRPLQQLRAARRAALHPGRQHHERRAPSARKLFSMAIAPARPTPAAAWLYAIVATSGMSRRQRHRRRRRSGLASIPHDDRQEALLARVRRRVHGAPA